MHTRKWLTTLIVVGVLTALGLLVFKRNPLPPNPPLPSPNGYDDFVKAGLALTGGASGYSDWNEEKLRRIAIEKAELLRLVRLGLTRECRVPNDYSPTFLTARVTEFISFKEVAFGFAIEGKVAELDNRMGDAAKSYLDAIFFGNESSRGGVLISRLVGTACEGIGLNNLQKLSNKLSAKECRDSVRFLESIDKKRELVSETLNHEKEWARQAESFREKISSLWPPNYRHEKQGVQFGLEEMQSRERKFKSIMINFAARAYELEKANAPKALLN